MFHRPLFVVWFSLMKNRKTLVKRSRYKINNKYDTTSIIIHYKPWITVPIFLHQTLQGKSQHFPFPNKYQVVRRMKLNFTICSCNLCTQSILIIIIGIYRTWKYFLLQVVKAASPVLLRVIVLGAFFIYCTVSNGLFLLELEQKSIKMYILNYCHYRTSFL